MTLAKTVPKSYLILHLMLYVVFVFDDVFIFEVVFIGAVALGHETLACRVIP